MKEIQLTKGYIALVDDEDFERASQHNWSAKVDRRKDGTIKNVYAARKVKIEGKTIHQRLHSFILGTREEVDHKNHNGLDDQKHNLREAHGNNAQNASIRSDNTSGFKGVVRDRCRNQWRWKAFINLEAACAYDMAAVKHFGEFAHCNFATGGN